MKQHKLKDLSNLGNMIYTHVYIYIVEKILQSHLRYENESNGGQTTDECQSQEVV